MNNVWSKSGNSYRLSEISHQQLHLPVGVYRLEYNEPFGYFYLEHVQDQFSFPYKIYGIETDFIQRVKKSWDNTKGNMGVLLNGLKGTGKTVTAELICNEMDVPVILIQKHYGGLVSFLNSVQQDVIIFIDEYEKIYNKYDNSLLSVMDGAFRTESRKMFLLTTNELTIEKNMLQRPSRIRYIKSYTDLTLDVIMEVVDDKLVHKHLRDCTIKMISELPIITMDLVKSVIEEVNIHNEDPALFKDIFNVQGDQAEMYNVYTIAENGSKVAFAKNVSVAPTYFSAYDEGESMYIQRHRIGTIVKFINKSQMLIEIDAPLKPMIASADEPKVNKHSSAALQQLLKETEDDEADDYRENVMFFFEPAIKTHRSFNNAAF